MSSELEDQIGAIIEAEQQPVASRLHYLLWGFIGLLGVLFAVLLAFVLIFLLRTAVLYGLVNLIGQ